MLRKEEWNGASAKIFTITILWENTTVKCPICPSIQIFLSPVFLKQSQGSILVEAIWRGLSAIHNGRGINY